VTTRDAILRDLGDILRDQFAMPALVVSGDSMIEDFPDWDSIAHVQIVVALENRFAIRFPPEEFTDFSTIAELVDRIGRRLAESGEPSDRDGPRGA
jgi:acyl carrier protein